MIRKFVIACLVVGVLLYLSGKEQVVICESGSFVEVKDGYLKLTAACNLGNANGKTITVLVID